MNANNKKQPFFLGKIEEPDFVMYRKTYTSYLRQAQSYLTRFVDSDPTPVEPIQGILRLAEKALIALQGEEGGQRTSDSWRKLRRSLVVYFKALRLDEISERFNAAKNLTPPARRARKTGKLKRLITVSSGDFETFIRHLQSKRQYYCAALCIVAHDLGLRPCEMYDVDFTVNEGGKLCVKIPPHKNTRRGELDTNFQRGIERELIVPYSAQLANALSYCKSLKPGEVKRIQERIRKASIALWPRRSTHFCLYSLRYTMGSQLKAAHAKDPMGAVKIAAVLGHKKTSSARSYGNIRSSAGGDVPVASDETLARVIDDRKKNHGRRAQNRKTPSYSGTTKPKR